MGWGELTDILGEVRTYIVVTIISVHGVHNLAVTE